MIPRHFDWVESDGRFRLAIMPHPRGHDRLFEEVRSLKSRGVDILVSLLTPEETSRLGLENAAGWCALAGIRHLGHSIPDHSVPVDPNATLDFLRTLAQALETGQSAVVHCFAGIGRSGLVATATMVLLGFDLEEARLRLSRARGIDVPETQEQHRWLTSFAAGIERKDPSEIHPSGVRQV